jgi:hypothetical protein
MLKNSSNNVLLVNWWSEDIDNSWLYRFIVAQAINITRPLALCSVFGPRQNIISIAKSHQVIFFSGEYISNKRYPEYSDYCLSLDIAAALGFDYIDDERYVRFPLWLMYSFKPDSSEYKILRDIQRLRFPNKTAFESLRFRFCALIASHDSGGQREKLLVAASKSGYVCCPGNYRRNSVSLQLFFKNDKRSFLRLFKFNICPENISGQGYTTEKLFDAIWSGCIPIYFGSNGSPEPRIVNPETIIFLNESEDNINAVEQSINELYTDRIRYSLLSRSPRLLPSAEEEIIHYFTRMLAVLHKSLI